VKILTKSALRRGKSQVPPGKQARGARVSLVAVGQASACHALSHWHAPASGSPYPVAGRSPSPSRLRLTRICLRCAWRLSRRRRRPGVGSGLRSPGKARLPHAHVRAGGPGEYQPTEVGKANSGTMPGVRVKMAPLVKYAGERETGSPKPPQLNQEGGGSGLSPTVETAYVTSAGRMPERRHIRASEAQDGRSERPARRYGVTPSRIG
jgi:hypothetical protein